MEPNINPTEYNDLGQIETVTNTKKNGDLINKFTYEKEETKDNLNISASDEYLTNGEKVTFTISGKYEDGKVIPDYVLNKTVWKSECGFLSFDKNSGKKVVGVYSTEFDDPGLLKFDKSEKISSYSSKPPINPGWINFKVTATLNNGKTASVYINGHEPYINNRGLYLMKSLDATTSSAIRFKPSSNRLYSTTSSSIDFRSNDEKYKLEEQPKLETMFMRMSKEPDIIIAPKKDKDEPSIVIPDKGIGEEETQSQSNKIIETYNYDTNGNLLSKIIDDGIEKRKGEEFTYNQLTNYKNNITGQAATYDYYTDGLRKSKTVNGETTKFYNDGSNVIIESDGSNNLTSRYFIGLNYIRKQDAKNNKYYYLYDAHGDVTVLTDSNGNVVNRYDYDIYGKEKSEGTQIKIDNPIRYTGQYFDEESGMYHLRARYYSPEIMRFISEDTYRGYTNLYSYCFGNPIAFMDPSGHIARSIFTDTVEHGSTEEFYYLSEMAGTTDLNYVSLRVFEAEYTAGAFEKGASFVIGFIPVAGDLKDLQEVFTGVDYVTMEKLSGGQRIITGICVLLPIANGKAAREVTQEFGEKIGRECLDNSGQSIMPRFASKGGGAS